MPRQQFGWALVPETNSGAIAQVRETIRANLHAAGCTDVTITVDTVSDLFPLALDPIPVIPGFVVYAEGDPPW